jgi:hypothetical protein
MAEWKARGDPQDGSKRRPGIRIREVVVSRQDCCTNHFEQNDSPGAKLNSLKALQAGLTNMGLLVASKLRHFYRQRPAAVEVVQCNDVRSERHVRNCYETRAELLKGFAICD